MKRILMLTVCCLVATSVFALGNRENLTEEEALARIDQKIQSLGLSLVDAEAAEQAFLAIRDAGVQIRNALSLVNDALDGDAEAKELNEIAAKAKQLRAEGRNPQAFEKEVRAMLPERAAVQAQDQVQEKTSEKASEQASDKAAASTGGSSNQDRPAQPAAPATPGKP